ncbi:MAG: YfiR family protein [candidate division Zixibacteria bacterium]|nr:YfiR family protein [candidate division Zixibacteria bacterium]
MRKLLTVCLWAILAMPVIGQDQADQDAEFEAKFVLDLLDKVTWPDKGQGSDTETAVITVVGPSALTPKLREMAAGRKAGQRRIEIREAAVTDDFTGSAILFIATSSLRDLARILKKVDGTTILTVSGAEEFARYGVMINFYKEEGDANVKYEINRLVVKFAGLKIDEGLVKKARII